MDALFYINYLLKPFVAAKKTFTTSKGLSIALPAMVATISAFHIEWKAFIFFLIIVFVDFVTGLLVSFKIAKDEAKSKGKYATKQTTKHGIWARILFKIKFYNDVIESQKLRLSLLKLVVYLFVIIGTKTIQILLQIKPFSFSFSDAKWTITLVSIAVCIGIELRSIIAENFKKLGYDITDKILSAFKSYKEIKKEFNEE